MKRLSELLFLFLGGILQRATHVKNRYVLVNLNAEPKSLPDYNLLRAAVQAVGLPIVGSSARLKPGTRVLITGSSVAAQELHKLCLELRQKHCFPILVTDALDNFEELRPILHELNELQLAQISPSIPLICLLKGIGSEFVYAYPKVDVTTTMAVLFDGGKKVLVMVRDRDPFKGWFSLPGGFLDSMLETLKQCAVRELHEEVFKKAKRILLQPDELTLIDVRSDPGRDKRGHVVDHGYAWLVPADRQEEVLASIEAGDDARKGSAKVITVEEALANGLAFDHGQFLRAAVERLAPKA